MAPDCGACCIVDYLLDVVENRSLHIVMDFMGWSESPEVLNLNRGVLTTDVSTVDLYCAQGSITHQRHRVCACEA